MKPFTVTILGSGTSTGVPVVGCDCEVCASKELRNQRLRASILLTDELGRHLVIDTGPDFRAQMLASKVKTLQHVLYTHTHADHCHGFDDLRAFNFRSREPMQLYLAKEHIAYLKEAFKYAFVPTGYEGAVPQVKLHEIFPEQSFRVLDYEIDSLLLPHGNSNTLAFRVGSFAYATDFKSFTPAQIAKWRGKIKTMVASGVHWRQHNSHSTVPETLQLFADLEVERGYVTHLSHEVEYLRDSKRMPPNVQLAYDGMTITL